MSCRTTLGLGVVGLLAACGQSHLELDYALMGGLTPAVVVRVETGIDVAPGNPRDFTADLPYRSVGDGVGYEVRDFDGDGRRSVLITQDATLGYVFKDSFIFTLLPPSGGAPALTVEARAFGSGLSDVLADTGVLAAKFGQGHVKLALANLRCGEHVCSGGTVCCQGSCVELASDGANCGACGMSCEGPGESCSGGECRCNGGGSCGSGQTCCPGLGCIDTTNNPANCGGCGVACALGSTCDSGHCSCGGVACDAGQACCNGTCTTGGCACGATTCATDTPICCTTDCTNLDDDSHCGSCGVACAAPFTCVKATCQCNGNGVCKSGDACCSDGCKTLANDPQNCGACGQACGVGETCTGGKCVCGTAPACSAMDACCPAAGMTLGCVDPSDDKNNCGQCGVVCDATDTCTGGKCVCSGTNQQCSAAQTCCASEGCFDLTSEHDHCGACNKACAANELCKMGQCVPGTGTMCNPSCTNGTTCLNSACFCGSVQTACNGMGQICCSNTSCVDTFTDVKNCGSCGNICTGANPLCCNGRCTDGTTVSNCGACGTVCGLGGLLGACAKCATGYACVGLGGCP